MTSLNPFQAQSWGWYQADPAKCPHAAIFPMISANSKPSGLSRKVRYMSTSLSINSDALQNPSRRLVIGRLRDGCRHGGHRGDYPAHPLRSLDRRVATGYRDPPTPDGAGLAGNV